jgi:dihydrofolate synthase/folylpolyglutamate synthase
VQEVAAEMVAALPGGGLRIDGFPGTFPCGPIRGPGLRTDLAVAVTLWKQIVDVSDAHDARRAIEPAIAGLELPARIEVLDSDPPLVVDGAHTPESVAALRAALEEIGWPRPRSVVLSVCSDKRIDAILAEIIRLADEVFFTRCDPVRSLPPQELASRFEAASGIAVPAERVIVDPREAFERALALGLPVVITGSLYLAGALRRRAHEHRALVRPAS